MEECRGTVEGQGYEVESYISGLGVRGMERGVGDRDVQKRA